MIGIKPQHDKLLVIFFLELPMVTSWSLRSLSLITQIMESENSKNSTNTTSTILNIYPRSIHKAKCGYVYLVVEIDLDNVHDLHHFGPSFDYSFTYICWILSYTWHCTYNMKSCSQHGLFPLTWIVVDLTFCSFNVTYVLNLSGKKI